MSDPDLSHVSSSMDENTTSKSPKCASNDGSSPDICLRERVIKEVGVTSTAFIGPAFPPEKSTAKCDIEDCLSKFYKELEKIDTPDGVRDNSEKDVQPEPPTSQKSQDVPEGKITTKASSETSSSQNNSGRTKPSWPHWYRSEPYHLKRPVLNCDRSVSNQWPYTPPLNRPPYPRFHRPPFPHQPAYPHLQTPPPHLSATMNSSGIANQHYKSVFPAFPLHGDSTHHFGGNDQRCYNADTVTVEWSRDRREDWSCCDEVYDRPQRFMSENEQWEQQHEPHDKTHRNHSAFVLILMRGLPGSGKSTLARDLLSTGPSGVILSTDDYFAQKDGYRYDPGFLGAAHEWNQSRAKDALRDGRSPIIIDNTNLQAWEMKPYVKMALERGYTVDFCEPDTSWKFDPRELEKRNKHGVPQEKIAQMMDRFSSPISIDIVMSSEEPAHVNQRRRPDQLQIRKKQHFY